MKRACAVAALLLCGGLFAVPAKAQMGMGQDIFVRPSLAKYFNPVQGKGSEYRTLQKDKPNDPPRTTQIFIVGQEDGGHWMEFVATGDKDMKGQIVGKILMSVDGNKMKSTRVVFQQPGQPAMEMTMDPSRAAAHSEENAADWHLVGSESVTVPAGTYTADHYRNDTRDSDIWVSSKIAPFGLIKETSKHSTMELTKELSGMTDQIKGPVQKFDPQMLRQQMMEQMQKQQQPKP